MKRNAIVRIVLFSLALLVLLFILGVALAVDRFGFSLSDIRRESEDGFEAPPSPMAIDDEICTSSFDASDLHSIDIDWAAGNIYILTDAKATQITVSEPAMGSAKEQMVCTVSGKTLKIEFSQEDFHVIGIHKDFSKDLAITVPLSWNCQELELDVASANVEIYNMTIRTVDFDGASGVCSFTDCMVTELDVDTASGDIQFTGSLENLECDAMSASCQLALTNHPHTVDISTMSGDLLLVLPEDCGFTLSMDAMSSKFTSDFPTTISNGSHIHGDGSCRIHVDGMSGDVVIRKNTEQQ